MHRENRSFTSKYPVKATTDRSSTSTGKVTPYDTAIAKFLVGGGRGGGYSVLTIQSG